MVLKLKDGHPGDAQAERDAAAGKYTESISGEDTGSFLRGGAFLMTHRFIG